MPKPPLRKPKKKVCPFCKDKVDLHRLQGHRRCCASSSPTAARSAPAGSPATARQHQRDVAKAVKNAREMALLPYTSTAR